MRAFCRCLLGDRRGASAAEFAMVLPCLLLLLAGIVEIGRAIWMQSTLSSAVAAAARCASVNANLCGAPAATQSYAASQATGLNLDASAFTVTKQFCGNQVAANVPFSFVFDQLLPYAITLTAQACYPS
jgi:Flp pilus assembly protein TadG